MDSEQIFGIMDTYPESAIPDLMLPEPEVPLDVEECELDKVRPLMDAVTSLHVSAPELAGSIRTEDFLNYVQRQIFNIRTLSPEHSEVSESISDIVSLVNEYIRARDGAYIQLAQEHESLKTKNANLKRQMKDTGRGKTKLELENLNLKMQSSRLVGEKDQLASEIEILKQDLSNALRAGDHHLERSMNLEKQLTEASQARSHAEEQLQEFRQQERELDNQIGVLNQERKDLEEQGVRATQANESLQGTVESLTAEFAELHC